MSIPSVPTPITKETNASVDDTQLHGRWLLLGRAAWGALVCLTLAVFFVSLPIYLDQLQIPCAEYTCEFQQLTMSQVEALKGIGLSLDGYATFSISFAFACIAVCLLVSTLIVWRKANDRMAIIVALLLVTLGPVIETSNLPVGYFLMKIL